MRLFGDISSLFSDHLFRSYDTTQENLYVFRAKVSGSFFVLILSLTRRLTGFLKGGVRVGGGGVKSSQIFFFKKESQS